MSPSSFFRIVLGLMLLFAAGFAWLQLAPLQWELIFLKTLRSYDESLNATVAANLLRDAFPPAVRLNPLIEAYQGWLEGPLWQHIPPLFLYVPLLGFALDGGASPEVFRLSYALVELATGLVFIGAVAAYTRSLLAAGCAALAAFLWAWSPFTLALVNGERFGVSDTVLAFATTVAFAAVLYYLARREQLTPVALALLGLAVAFPLLVKHVLGAIPAATLAALMLRDRRRLGAGPWVTFAVFAVVLIGYYGGLYLTSPETFRGTFGVAFAHVGENYEGWARPWHYFLTRYLPVEYLPGPAWPLFLAGVVVGAFALTREHPPRAAAIARLALGWFVWNLVAVSLITAKAPNFIFQTTMFGLFFALYGPALWLARGRHLAVAPARAGAFLGLAAVLALGSFGYGAKRFLETRKSAYDYNLPLERIYHMAESARAAGWGPRDLVLIKLSDPEEAPPPYASWLLTHRGEEASFDYWGRYTFMFLTGVEAWLYDDFRRLPLEAPALRQALARKYDRVHVVVAQEKPWPPFPAGGVERAVRVDGVWLVTLSSLDPGWVPRLPPHPHPSAPRWTAD